MKKLIVLITALIISITLSGCSEIPDDIITLLDDEVSEEIITETELQLKDELIESATDSIQIYSDDTTQNDFGSTGALSDDAFTIEEMLVYALQDEFAAKAEYTYIIANFDVTNPFSNIINSEETHINLLLPLFDTYTIDVPVNDAEDHLIVISSIEDTFATGVLAEELNIAMYNLFLSQEGLPEDIYDTFTKLRDASLSHLSAFEKNLNRF